MKKKFGSNKFEKILNGWGIGLRSAGGKERGVVAKKIQTLISGATSIITLRV